MLFFPALLTKLFNGRQILVSGRTGAPARRLADSRGAGQKTGFSSMVAQTAIAECRGHRVGRSFCIML